MKFKLAEDEIPLAFFDEIGLNVLDIIQSFLEENHFNIKEDERFDLEDKVNDELCELKDDILFYSPYSEEVDEGSGTWGYYIFEIEDIQGVRAAFRLLILEVIQEIISV